jgi:multimeric flavodoxin WrbA
MKKVMLLMGSPRKNGNTVFVAQRVLESMAELEELAVEYVDCARLGNKPRGCAACYRCRPMKFRCAINDATAEVINRLADYDIVLLATPVYSRRWWTTMKRANWSRR